MSKTTLIALALGIGTMGLTMVACTDSSADTATTQAATPSIKVFPLIRQEVTDYGEWFGYLRGQQDTDIRPRISGFLISQEYKDGTHVKAGDILFRIDPELYAAELERAKANLQAAEAALIAAEASAKKADMDVARYSQLVKTSAVSEKDLTDAQQTQKMVKAQVDVCKANVEQNKAAVNNAQINLDYTIIRAPYDGIVGAAKASQGELVSPATVLTNIALVDPIRVDFSISGNYLVSSNIGKQTGEHSYFELVMEDGSQYEHPGRIVSMESQLTDSGLLNIEGAIPNPSRLLRAGMPVRVRVPLKTKPAFLVHKDAIRTVLLNSFIVVVDKKNIPHMVPVNVGGEYTVTVTEADGFNSEQTLVSVQDYDIPLAERLKAFGIESPEEALIVTDRENSMFAVTTSSANSRLPKNATPGTIKTEAFSFRPAPLPAVAAAQAKQQQGGSVQASTAKATLPPFPVKVRNMLQQDVSVQETWYGHLRGVEETDIRPRVSGFLISQNFKDGALVKKGDILFQIDPAPYKADLDKALANLAAAGAAKEQAAAQLEMSRINYERYRKLSAATPGAISDKTVTDAATAVETSEADLRKAEASVAQSEAAVKQAKINLSYTTITAPFDGRIGIRKPSIGALVSPEDAQPLVTLSSVHPMRVDFDMSGKATLAGIATYRQKVAAGKQDQKGEFEIILENGAVYPHLGRVITADNSINTTTGTLKVIGQVDNADAELRSGMPVRVRADLTPIRHACLVPARAPLNAKGMDLIILLKPDNTPAMLPITKGPLVTIPVANPDGKKIVQPMQVIDADRASVSALMLAKAKAPSLEALVLGGAKVKDWGEFLLRQAGVSSYKELLEKQQGKSLTEEDLANSGAANWGELLLRYNAARTFRAMALKMAEAQDELDLIARGQGCNSVMEMVLKGMGFENPANTPVVVEGSLMAAQSFAANSAAGADVNKLTPTPFIYTPTKTVEPSVTAQPESMGNAK